MYAVIDEAEAKARGRTALEKQPIAKEAARREMRAHGARFVETFGIAKLLPAPA